MAVGLRIPSDRGVALGHELGEPIERLEGRRATAIAQTADKGRIAERIAPEPRPGHVVAAAESFDPFDQLGVRGNIHGPIDSWID